MTGLLLTFIGLAYCIDPNLLLARYDLSVNGASEDNMYRGAYGGGDRGFCRAFLCVADVVGQRQRNPQANPQVNTGSPHTL